MKTITTNIPTGQPTVDTFTQNNIWDRSGVTF